MSASQTLALPLESAPAVPLECTGCGSKMETRPNPYFGAGLATHREVALCKGCFRVAFVPEPVQQEAPAESGGTGKFRGLFGRAA